MLSQDVCLTVCCWVNLCLSVCLSVMIGYCVKTARQIVKIPSLSDSVILRLSRLMHDELHWLDVTDRVQFKLAVLVYRCLHGTAPL